jgi:hypothetical protein
MQALIAIKLFRAKQGAYPINLVQAADSLGIAIPNDPLTGKLFTYNNENGMLKGKMCSDSDTVFQFNFAPTGH